MIVYNVKTGEPMECHAVDGRELIASGHYSKDKPKAKKSMPAKKGK